MVPCKAQKKNLNCSYIYQGSPEFLQDMLIPWYHYVPTKLDYSDILYVIHTSYFYFYFFGVSENGQIDELVFFLQRYPGLLSRIT